jgi:hypothetical protein
MACTFDSIKDITEKKEIWKRTKSIMYVQPLVVAN